MWRILIVDDDETMLDLARATLECIEPSFSVTTVTSGLVGLLQHAADKCDALVVDFEMPDMDGLEMLDRLRSSGDQIPFIMFTGRGREDVAMKALNLGADYYLMKQGSPSSVYGELAHVTKRAILQRQVQQAFAVSEREKSLILSTISDIVLAIDKEYKILWANESAASFCKQHPERLIGKICYEAAYGRNHPCVNCPVGEVFKTGEIRQVEVLTEDGQIWHHRSFPMRDDEDNLIGVVKTCADITASRKTEVALKASELSREKLYNTAQVGLYRVRIGDGSIMECNDLFAHTFGYSSREECVSDFVGSERFVDPNIRQKLLSQLQQNGEVRHFEAQLTRSDGTPFWGSFSSKLYPELECIEGAMTDVTEAKNTAIALEISELKHKQMFKDARVPLYRTTLIDGKLLACNDLFAELAGFPNREACLANFDLAAFYDEETRQRLLSELREKGKVKEMEIRCINPDIPTRWVSLSAKMYQEMGYMEGALVDITTSKQAARALQQSEAKYMMLVESMSDGLVVQDVNGVLAFANKRFCDMLDYRSAEIIGRPVNDFKDMTKRKSYDGLSQRGTQGDDCYRLVWIGKKGKKVPTVVSPRRIINENGQFEGHVAVITDDTQRKRMEEALSESENYYCRMFEDAQVGLCTVRMSDGKYLECNEICAKMGGYASCEEAIAGFEEFPPLPELVEKLRNSEELVTKGELKNLEIRISRTDGSPMWIDFSARRFPERDVIECCLLDITDLKLASIALKESEERFRDIVAKSTIGLRIHDAEGCCIDANQALLDLAGVSDFEALRNCHLFDPKNKSSRYEEQLRNGEVVSYELSFDPSLGRHHSSRKGVTDLEVQIIPLGVSEGEAPNGFMAQIVDVTDQKRAKQEALSLFEDSPTPMMLLDGSKVKMFANELAGNGVSDYQGHFAKNPNDLIRLASRIEIVNVNKACIALHGAPSKEDYIATLDEHVGPKELSVIQEIMMLMVQGQTAISKRMTTFSWAGDAVHVIVNVVVPAKHHDTWLRVIVSLVDVTDVTTSKQALDESDRRFKEFVDMLPQALYELDATAKFTYLNRYGHETLGYTEKEIAHGFNCLDSLVPADRQRAMEHLTANAAGEGRGLTEYTLQTKNGTTVPVLLNAAAIFDGGKHVGWRGIAIDISERKAALKLLVQQKQELSEFVHSMAHDIKNMLFTIKGYADLIKTQQELRFCDVVMRLTESAGNLLTRSVELADAGLVAEMLDDLDLTELVNDVATQVIPEEIHFSAANLQTVPGDKEKLSQVFQNLLTNAVVHGEPTKIEIHQEETHDGFFLLIQNDGRSISAGDRQRVFQKGFSTRAEGGGFGLKIVKKIVEAHGWQISLDDSEDTTFRIRIPLEK